LYCPNCGHPLLSGVFCRNCGQVFSDPGGRTPDWRLDRLWPMAFVPAVEGRKWVLKAVLAMPVLLILALAVGLPLALWLLYRVVRYLIL
jgi:hypothetical protein